MLPDYKKAKKLSKEFINEFLQKATKFHAGNFFGDIPERPIFEGDRMIHKYAEDFTHETPIQKISSGFSIDKNELVSNPVIIFKKLDEMAKELADERVRITLEAVNEITEKTGNVVNRKGRSITPEGILETFEKMTIDFNSDGTPRMPSIISGPALAEEIKKVMAFMTTDEFYSKKFAEIIENQKKNWDDRENNRKLVD